MDFWIKFWTILFFASLGLFSALSIVVAIGGIFDIRALFKQLTKDADEAENRIDTT